MIDELAVSSRLTVLEQWIKSSEVVLEQILFDRYLSACQSDLSRLSQLHLVPFLAGTGTEIETCVTKDLSFDASIEKVSSGKYIISINLGVFLAIDDFSGISLEFYTERSRENDFHVGDALKFRSNDFQWGDRFVDYTFLFDEVGRIALVSTRFGVIRNFLSNLKLLWLIFHELGHLELGHFELFANRSNSARYHENGGYEPTRSAKLSGEREFYSAEYEADAFACYFLYTTFENASSLDVTRRILNAEFDFRGLYLILTSVSCHMGLMLQKADILNNAEVISSSNHAPLSRVLNTLVTYKYVFSFNLDMISEDVVAKRQDQIRKFEKHAAFLDVLCDVIPNIVFISDFLGFHVTADRLPDCDLRIRDEAFRYELNDVKRHETLKFILAIYHSEMLLNPFLNSEEMFLHFENWKAAVVANGKANSSNLSISNRHPLIVSRMALARVFLNDMWRSMNAVTSGDEYHQDEVISRLLDTVRIAKRVQRIRFTFPEKQ